MINESYPILNQKYYLLQKLGQGATSCVFLGCPIDNDKTLLAIKIITNLKIKQEAFEQETKILSQTRANPSGRKWDDIYFKGY